MANHAEAARGADERRDLLRYGATMLKPGDKAPDIALTEPHGDTVKRADFKGRKVLVYFYPK